MDIDLSLLHTGVVESIDISGEYTLDKEYYQNTEIIELSPLKVEGIVTRKENEDFELEDYATCSISGGTTKIYN